MWIGFHGGSASNPVCLLLSPVQKCWNECILKGIHSTDESVENDHESSHQDYSIDNLDVEQINVSERGPFGMVHDIVHGKNGETETEEEGETYHLCVHQINRLGEKAFNVFLLGSDTVTQENIDLISGVFNSPFCLIRFKKLWDGFTNLCVWEGLHPLC